MTPGPRLSRSAWIWALGAIVLTGASFALFSRNTPSPPRSTAADAAQAAQDTTAHVVAYYFHTNYRCVSCRKIEAYSRVALESGFAGDLASKRLRFRPINLDEEGNGHFVKDYQLYTKALVLSEMRAGREVRWTNLTRVWELLGDESAFVTYVQKETHAFVDELP